ncbi:hypothetical protein HDV00_000690 [Rhizophlyctis rosea]|nr:hypothetical protein HDV00_000690 [Rhizophlyctis rosea]
MTTIDTKFPPPAYVPMTPPVSPTDVTPFNDGATPVTPTSPMPFSMSARSVAAAERKRVMMNSLLHLLQLAASILFVAGIVSQATYGTRNVCLLYVRNYHNGDDSLMFSARSVACPNAVGIGTAGIVLATTLLLLTLLTAGNKTSTRLPDPTYKSYTLLLCITSTIFALIALTMAAFASAGLKQTCHEFEALHAVQCGDVFANGFFEEGTGGPGGGERIVYSKSLAAVKAAIAGGWLMGLFWAIGAVWKGWEWKNGRVRWW